MESTTNKNPSSAPTEAKDKSVKIRIISKRGNTREETRRELMEMSADRIDRLFESYEFRDPMDHTLTRNVVFQELLKLAVEGSDCLIEEARIGEKSWRFDYFNIK